VGHWVLNVLFPPFRSRAGKTSWLGRSDRTIWQWEVSLYTCEALSERAKTSGRSCVTFIRLLWRLVFEDSELVMICTEHSGKRRNKFPLVNVRGGNSDAESLLTRPSTCQCRSFHKIQASECLHVRKKLWVAVTVGDVSDRIALFPFQDFAVRTAKSVLALLSVIGRISVATRR
jgi:hypothetical protein